MKPLIILLAVSYRIEHPGGTQRAATAEEGLIECSHFGGDGAREAAKTLCRSQHNS